MTRSSRLEFPWGNGGEAVGEGRAGPCWTFCHPRGAKRPKGPNDHLPFVEGVPKKSFPSVDIGS